MSVKHCYQHFSPCWTYLLLLRSSTHHLIWNFVQVAYIVLAGARTKSGVIVLPMHRFGAVHAYINSSVTRALIKKFTQKKPSYWMDARSLKIPHYYNIMLHWWLESSKYSRRLTNVICFFFQLSIIVPTSPKCVIWSLNQLGIMLCPCSTLCIQITTVSW